MPRVGDCTSSLGSSLQSLIVRGEKVGGEVALNLMFFSVPISSSDLNHGQQVDHYCRSAGGAQRRVKELNKNKET